MIAATTGAFMLLECTHAEARLYAPKETISLLRRLKRQYKIRIDPDKDIVWQWSFRVLPIDAKVESDYRTLRIEEWGNVFGPMKPFIILTAKLRSQNYFPIHTGLIKQRIPPVEMVVAEKLVQDL